MKAVISTLLILIGINALGQLPFVQTRVDSVDKYIAGLGKPKTNEVKFYYGQIDSNRSSTDMDISILSGTYDRNRLKTIEYKFQDDMMGEWTITYYLSDEEELICVQEDHFPIVMSRGPNYYERRFKARYYFKNEKLIYRKIEGTDEEIANGQKEMTGLLNDFMLFKELIMKAPWQKVVRWKATE